MSENNAENGKLEIKKYVSYLRVSTDRQGKSGLGLEAQRVAVQNFFTSKKVDAVIQEFIEVESGTKNGSASELMIWKIPSKLIEM